MKKKAPWLTGVVLLSIFLFNPVFVFAADIEPDAFGFRIGKSSNSNAAEDFEEYDIYARWNLPWNWNTSSELRFDTHIEMAVGLLKAGGDNGLVVAAGPELILSHSQYPFELNLGISPAFVSNDEYGNEDIGGNFHFVSHIGLLFKLGDSFSLGYRFQHQSNAGIETPNPGIDMHLLALEYRF